MTTLLEQVKQFAPKSVRSLYRRIRPSNYPTIPEKFHLIDLALERGARRFADLGGMWRINGAYAIYAADHGAESVVEVDHWASEEFLRAQRRRKNLRLQVGNFGRPTTAAQIGALDAVTFYDVLVHQVRPDWDAILATYAQHARWVLVYNQQFIGPKTVRLIDQGEAWYRRHAFVNDEDVYRNFFERPDDVDPRYDDDRHHRDICDVWQWGITDADLLRVMHDLGYVTVYEKHCGPVLPLEEIVDRAFLFERQS